MTRLQSHLDTGVTTLARCWSVVRRDGVAFAFTDHDQPLDFDGLMFKPDAGMTARAVMQGTGLSVDNSEAMGAISDHTITEADIEAGRFDDADVKAWIVNWANVETRSLRFAGTIGEIRRAGGAFHAELRGLTERLNQMQGRVYQRGCAAILGDRACGFDLNTAGYVAEVAAQTIEGGRRFVFDGLGGFDDGWFERGRLVVTTGDAAGLVGVIKRDVTHAGQRRIEVWEAFRSPVAAGDLLRLEAGCDKRYVTCRDKFGNMVNFQGFPDIPGDDWLVSVPIRSGENLGGSLRRDGG